MREIVTALRVDSNTCGAFGTSEFIDKDARHLAARSPINGQHLADVPCATPETYERVVQEALEVFREWRGVPAPERGSLIRKVGEALRDSKASLGKLVSLETGKILVEGEGEIQEAIDIADFAVGLSRQLYGKTMHSERREHRMYEQWHPLGPVGVITAFNFPAAVWAWNAMIAAVCGDVVIWKPSELAPLTALAINRICREVAKPSGFEGVFSLVIGDGPDLGRLMAADTRIPCISATGSCAMGRSVGKVVGDRLGRCILELGGNNAVTVLADADMQLVVAGVLFGAVGTAGQRCTSIRRAFVHEQVYNSFVEKLAAAYKQVRIGSPLEKGVLMGPLISERAVVAYQSAIERSRKEGGEIVYGGRVLPGMSSALYVEPTIVRVKTPIPVMQEETFAPILYVVPIKDVREAIALNNQVPQGLSSSIFTRNLQDAEKFLSSAGSDCGIANVNMGTSGAEIGGAFGGEKDTGGGREAGSDSWKQYMRRQTCSINFGDKMPLAQGIVFS